MCQQRRDTNRDINVSRENMKHSKIRILIALLPSYSFCLNSRLSLLINIKLTTAWMWVINNVIQLLLQQYSYVVVVIIIITVTSKTTAADWAVGISIICTVLLFYGGRWILIAQEACRVHSYEPASHGVHASDFWQFWRANYARKEWLSFRNFDCQPGGSTDLAIFRCFSKSFPAVP
jgi:hypothetical protein